MLSILSTHAPPRQRAIQWILDYLCFCSDNWSATLRCTTAAIATAFDWNVEFWIVLFLQIESDTTDDVLANSFDAHVHWQTKSTDSQDISQSPFGFGEFAVDV